MRLTKPNMGLKPLIRPGTKKRIRKKLVKDDAKDKTIAL